MGEMVTEVIVGVGEVTKIQPCGKYSGSIDLQLSFILGAFLLLG